MLKKIFHKCALTGLLAGMSIGYPASLSAYEVVIDETDARNISDRMGCVSNDQPVCTNTLLSFEDMPNNGGIVTSFNVKNNGSDNQILLSMDLTHSVDPISPGTVCRIDLVANFASNTMVIRRYLKKSGGSSKYCTPNSDEFVEYQLLDALLPEYSNNIRMNVYFSENFIWLEAYDKANPVMTPYLSTPTFFGLGATIYSVKDMNGFGNILLEVTDWSGPYSPQSRFVPPSGDFLRIAYFKYPDLIDHLNEYYSARPIAPFRESGRDATAVTMSILAPAG